MPYLGQKPNANHLYYTPNTINGIHSISPQNNYSTKHIIVHVSIHTVQTPLFIMMYLLVYLTEAVARCTCVPVALCSD